jgi:glycosyltransferase involved in cell wall biosynthesis
VTAEILPVTEVCEPVGPPSAATRVKVTYVVGSLRDAGAERQVLELIRLLDRAVFEPSLIVMEEVNLQRAAGLADRCYAIGLAQGGHSRVWPLAWPLVRSVCQIKKHMQQINSDIVHGFLPGPSILGAAAARWARVPVIIGSRRSLATHYRRGSRLAGWADTAAFHMAGFNLGNSQAVSRQMVEIAGCPAAKCGTIPNGVDLQRFRPDLSRALRRQLGWTQQEVVLGMVANFRPCKRHRDFVQAAAGIAQLHPQARFLMAGADSGSKQSVVQQIKDLGLADVVRVLDGVANPENVFAALDVYVCTSESEGFSNVLLEAMACGLPVIATRVGGNPEAVRDGETGFLVPPHQPEAVAEAAGRLLRDLPLQRTMGHCGRLRVEQEFSLQRMVRRHQELYLDLLKKRKPA